MRLLYVGNTGSVHFRVWPLHFQRLGHDVHVCHLHAGDPMPIQGVEWHRPATLLRVRPTRARRVTWRLSAAELFVVARKISADVVHSHQIIPTSYLAALARVRPHVATAWGSEVLVAAPSLQPVISLVAGTASLLTADSAHVLARLEAHGASSSRLRFVPWGVERNWLQLASGLSNDEAAAQLGLPSGRDIVLAPRGTLPLYRPADAVEAISRAARKQPRILGVVKVDELPGSVEVSELEQIARRLGVSENVLFHPAWAHEQMPFVYTAASVVVSVPASDSAPTSVVEALGLGRPCIVSDLPWIHEPHHREFRLRVVPVGDVQALTRAILESVERPDAAEAQVNRDLVSRKFDRTEIFAGMEEEYERLAATA